MHANLVAKFLVTYYYLVPSKSWILDVKMNRNGVGKLSKLTKVSAKKLDIYLIIF